MDRTEKGTEIKNLVARFTEAKSVIFAHNKGLKVSEVTELRRKLRGQGGQLKVVKNRLAKLALKEAGITGIDQFFKGPVTIASSPTDAVAPAKVLVDFAKDHETIVLTGGFLAGEVLDLNRLKALAALPSREVLYAKLMGCLLNPARQLVTVLAAVPKQLVTVVDAVGKTKTTNP